MKRPKRPAGTWVPALLAPSLSLLACGEDLPPISYRTDQAIIGKTFPEPLCEGDLAFIDSEIVRLEELLSAPDEGRIEIYLYDEPPPQCQFGCFVDERYIVSIWQFIDHELVHAVIAKFAQPNDFWDETAAESLRQRRTQRGGTTPAENRGKDDDLLDYNTVGHFGRWLLLEHGGIENMRQMLSGADFGDVYGLSFEEASAEYEATAPWSYPAPNACSEPRIESDGSDGFLASVPIDCTAADTSLFMGPGVVRTFEVEEPGAFDLVVEGGLGIRLLGCQTEVLWERPEVDEEADVMNESGSVLPIGRFFRSEESPHTVELEAGTYRMTIISDRDAEAEGTTVEVALTPAM